MEKIFLISNNLENHSYMISSNPFKKALGNDIIFSFMYDIQ